MLAKLRHDRTHIQKGLALWGEMVLAPTRTVFSRTDSDVQAQEAVARQIMDYLRCSANKSILFGEDYVKVYECLHV